MPGFLWRADGRQTQRNLSGFSRLARISNNTVIKITACLAKIWTKPWRKDTLKTILIPSSPLSSVSDRPDVLCRNPGPVVTQWKLALTLSLQFTSNHFRSVHFSSLQISSLQISSLQFSSEIVVGLTASPSRLCSEMVVGWTALLGGDSGSDSSARRCWWIGQLCSAVIVGRTALLGGDSGSDSSARRCWWVGQLCPEMLVGRTALPGDVSGSDSSARRC